MSATEGGCVCTDDDVLAERVRNMRSNYGVRLPLPVSLTINARLSEAQAAIALASLADFEVRVANNRHVFDAYHSTLQDVPGVRVVEPSACIRSNHQSVVIEIAEDDYGLSRDSLWSLLRAEGVRARRYFTPGVHRSAPFEKMLPQPPGALAATERLCGRVMQLPVGAIPTPEDAKRIASLVRDAHTYAEELRTRV